MKSKICLCNGTMLKKDLTRFAPLMLLTGLVLWIIGSVMKPVLEYADPNDLPEMVQIAMFVVVALSLFSAISLFTYLTKKKECDAIHALPIRRETLLFTKIIAAFIQFAVPFGIFYLIFPGDRGWFFQMAVSFCIWLFHFGLAVFVMMLVGRRLAGYILFSLLYDLGSSIYGVIQSLYLPLLPGVHLSVDATKLSPAAYLIDLDYENSPLAELLLPMASFALLGVGFLALALVAYRRRKLERAGDFLAVKWLEPVLAWLMGIYGAVFTVGISTLVEGNLWIGLAIGLTIGYFAARMFFARSIKVFNKKSLAGWLALVTFLAATLFVTSMDPLGVVNRVPETAQIESVSLYEEDYILSMELAYEYFGSGYTTADPAEIDELRRMHKNLLVANDQEVEGTQSYHNRFYLVYDLKNGSKLSRTYYVLGGEELKQVKYFLSQPEALVGSADIEEVLADISELRAFGVNGGTIHTERAFWEVFLPECESGWMYTPDPNGQSSWDIHFYSEEFGYRTVDIPLTAQKTIAWLENYFKDQG